MSEIISQIEQVTPAWLTRRLRQTGVLAQGRVATIQVLESSTSNPSTHYRLAVQYTPANIDGPGALFLKIANEDFPWKDDSEVLFYNTLVPAMKMTYSDKVWPFVRCYDAAFDPASKLNHVLLEDMSATHFRANDMMPPTDVLCEQVIDAYARFHAHWWMHPWLGRRVGRYLSGNEIDGFERAGREKFAQTVAETQKQLSPAESAMLHRAVSAWPRRRRERVVSGQGVTLVHRDPHPQNFLYPKDPASDCVKLIDWQSWRIDTGADDLAYLMAFHWPLNARERLERALLKRYHNRLVEWSVQDYTWDDCQYDYRASICRFLSILFLAKSGNWDRIRRGLGAFAVWECRNIL